MIYLGSLNITNMYLGDNSIPKAYLGDLLVYGQKIFGEYDVRVTYSNGRQRIDTYSDGIVTEGAYQSNISIVNAEIGSGITSIEKTVFKDCSSLTSITIPNSVTTINAYAFAKCSSLSSITIPNSVTVINSGLFYNCSGLSYINFGNTRTTVPSLVNVNAFQGSTCPIVVPDYIYSSWIASTNWKSTTNNIKSRIVKYSEFFGVTTYDYIKGFGSYFDTKYVPKSTTSVELKFDKKLGDSIMFMGRSSSKTKSFGFCCLPLTNTYKYRLDYNTTLKGFNPTNEKENNIVRIEPTKSYFNGVEYSSYSTYSSFANSIALFGANNGGTYGNFNRLGNKIFYFKIWSGTTLIHEYVGAVCNNEVGMYDKVDKVFFSPMGGNLNQVGNETIVCSIENMAYNNSVDATTTSATISFDGVKTYSYSDGYSFTERESLSETVTFDANTSSTETKTNNGTINYNGATAEWTIVQAKADAPSLSPNIVAVFDKGQGAIFSERSDSMKNDYANIFSRVVVDGDNIYDFTYTETATEGWTNYMTVWHPNIAYYDLEYDINVYGSIEESDDASYLLFDDHPTWHIFGNPTDGSGCLTLMDNDTQETMYIYQGYEVQMGDMYFELVDLSEYGESSWVLKMRGDYDFDVRTNYGSSELFYFGEVPKPYSMGYTGEDHNLEYIFLVDSNVAIPSYMLCNTVLKSITIGSAVMKIEEHAFANCSSLTSVTIANSVLWISSFAFQNCRSLTNITYLGTIAQWNSITKVNEWKQNAPITVVHCTDGDVSL